MKKDFEIIPDSLEKILTLNGYYYYWNRGSDKAKKIGLKAQEVEKVFPEVISKGNDGFLSVSYNHLVAVVIEAIKEFYEEFKILKSSDEAREHEIAAMTIENAVKDKEIVELKARLDKIEKILNSKKSSLSEMNK